MPELTLGHIPPEHRERGKTYISHDISGSVRFIDCDSYEPCAINRVFRWSIGFDHKTKELMFYDQRMAPMPLEAFIQLVTDSTPQYLTALLFFLPNPIAYVEALNDQP